MLDKFSSQSGIQVQYREMPADTGQYFDKLRTQLEAGAADIDVIAGDVIWPAQLASQGYIVDLSDRFPKSEQDKYLPAAVDSDLYHGKPYGVPWYIDGGLLYYRKDLLDKSGYSEPPSTWDELKEMASKVQRDTGTKYGFVFQGAQYEGGVCDGLRTWRSMIDSGVSPDAVSDYKEQETQVAFAGGDAVFARNWPYMFGVVNDPSQSQIKPAQVGVTQLPVNGNNNHVATSGGWTFLINATSEKQDEAWQLIQFMSEPDQQSFFLKNRQSMPTLKSLYDDQNLMSSVDVAEQGQKSILSTEPRPSNIPYYNDLSLKMQEQFNANLRGDASPEQAADTLQGQLETLVKRGGSYGY
jgi:multiple sugar transport system substrate-binding protein